MTIDKPAFIVGFRRRPQPTTFGRRAFYLIPLHDHNPADLLDSEEQEVRMHGSIAQRGGTHSKALEVVEGSPRAAEISTAAQARLRTLRGEG